MKTKSQNQNRTTSRHRRKTHIKSAFALFLALSLGGALTSIRAADADSLPGMGPQPVEYFYTGKPYDADTESYAFLYRSYDPEINRWTTVDPSGFPDGANNQVYAPNPFSEFDLQGLSTVTIGSRSFNLGSFPTAAHVALDLSGSTVKNSTQHPMTVTYSISGTFTANATVLGTGVNASINQTTSLTATIDPYWSVKLVAHWDVHIPASISFDKWEVVSYE